MSPLPEELLGTSPESFITYIGGLHHQHMYPLQWQGSSKDLNVYKVELGRLRYNHMNGRILDCVLQYCGENGFENNHFEVVDVTTPQHQFILHEFLWGNPDRIDVLEKFREGLRPSYTEPLICTHDGRIVNGNQRLDVFRQLYDEDRRQFRHLSHIWIAILPDDGTEEDFREVEQNFQEDELESKSFDWIQRGLSRRRDLEKGISLEVIAQRAGESTDEIESSINKIWIIDCFLDYLGTPYAYNTFRKGNHTQSIIEIQNGRQKLDRIKGTDNDRLIAELMTRSFGFMQDPDSAIGTGIGVYGHVRQVVELLVEEAPNASPKSKSKASNPRLNRVRSTGGTEEDESEEDESEEDGLILNIPVVGNGVTASDAAEAVRDETTVIRGRKAAKNRRNYASRELGKFRTVLGTIVDHWEQADIEQVPELIDEIDELLAQIRTLLGDDE